MYYVGNDLKKTKIRNRIMASINQPTSKPRPINFHGAAIIDEKGREIPITEEMVRQACKSFQGKSAKPQH